jgi:hypothetical protein
MIRPPMGAEKNRADLLPGTLDMLVLKTDSRADRYFRTSATGNGDLVYAGAELARRRSSENWILDRRDCRTV